LIADSSHIACIFQREELARISVLARTEESCRGDICYVSKALTPLQTVRYMKHTCPLTKLHMLAICILGLK
jgi:hypothetical protein